ncbi:hypothetical protein, partial [Sphingomonas sp. 32-62-10]|uniref:hypothetical protein n=1 Tax=Sphingomonas sp. 32-62-10 TaxID=1970436 RepID=UPI0035A85E5B
SSAIQGLFLIMGHLKPPFPSAVESGAKCSVIGVYSSLSAISRPQKPSDITNPWWMTFPWSRSVNHLASRDCGAVPAIGISSCLFLARFFENSLFFCHITGKSSDGLATHCPGQHLSSQALEIPNISSQLD